MELEASMRREVYMHQQAEVPFRFARVVLKDEPRWLISGDDPAEALGPEVGLQAQVSPFHLVRPVAVRFGPFRDSPQSQSLCYRELSWEAGHGRMFFPVMAGKLELSELTSNGVQLSLIGSYRAPLSLVRVTAKADAGLLRIHIDDNGVGMSPGSSEGHGITGMSSG
jgi:hypothetical protein